MKQDIYFYIVGTAGSGKSTFVWKFQEWCKLRGLDAYILNLDPGVEYLPYEPDVDIRDWISLSEIMQTHELGPNGAQIVCADMIALNLGEIKETIERFEVDYLLVDTPGQLELFVFREAGRYTIKNLNPSKTMVGYLIDPALANSPSSFVSQLLLSITSNFRLGTAQLNILSKTDLLSTTDIDLISKWSVNADELYTALLKEKPSMYQQINENIAHLIEEFGGFSKMIAYSKNDIESLTDIYTYIQQTFEAGEDLLKD